MKTGCLLSLLLLPIALLVWVRKEQKKRMSMPPEELADLEAEEAFGKIDDSLECIFCHSKGCVRARRKIRHSGDAAHIVSQDNLNHTKLFTFSPVTRARIMAQREISRTEEVLQTHCMNCTNTWEMFPPEEGRCER